MEGKGRWSVSGRSSRTADEDGWEPLEMEYDVPRGPPRGARAAGLSPAGVFGALLLVVAVVALVLNFTLPWVALEVQFNLPGNIPGMPGGGMGETHRDVLERDDLGDGSVYGKRLVDWPLAAFIVLMVTGLAVFAVDLSPGLPWSAHRGVQGVALLASAFFGFLLALTGTRWLGGQIGSWMSPDFPVSLELQAVPYVNLAAGVLILVGSLYFALPALAGLAGKTSVRRFLGLVEVRTATIMVAASAAGLLLMPLLPFITVDGVAIVHDEWDLASFREIGNDDQNIAQALGLVRVMVWVVLYVSLAGVLLAVLHHALGSRRESQVFLQVQALSVVPLVLMVVFAVLFYTRTGGVDYLGVYPNPFLPLTVAALVLGYGYYAAAVLVPFMRGLPQAPAVRA